MSTYGLEELLPEGGASHPPGATDQEQELEWSVSSAYVDLVTPCIEPSGIEVEPEHTLKLEKRGITAHLQTELWSTQTLFKETVVAKLLDAGRAQLATKIIKCHTQESYLTCVGCNKATRVWNRCENFWCPECQPRLSRDRKIAVEWWTKFAKQPKHVVLTVRNTSTITKHYVQKIKSDFSRLRRTRFAANWLGGFYSLECTNEGRGWHLHIHALVESRYIDSEQLAIQWARIVGQDFAIVKVQDARRKDYLREVTKYAVKGSELAGWTGNCIAEFIDAFTGVRTFGVFGNLYGRRQEWSEYIDSLRDVPRVCECGCSEKIFLSPSELEERLLTHDVRRTNQAAIPPPPKAPIFDFWHALSDFTAIAR